MPRLLAALTFTAILSTASTLFATVPGQLTVQGKLTDASGNPLPAGSKTFTFRVFNAENGGTELWPGGAGEVQTVVTDAAGLWSAKLGSQIALSDAVFDVTAAWLQVTVNDDQTITTLPRTRLVTVPYALRVATVDGATGGKLTSGIDLPYNGSTLDGNASGLRWMQGTDIQTAFGLDIFYGLFFQGSWNDLNDDFGVRAPTIDGTLGDIVFSVGRGGYVTTQAGITAQNSIFTYGYLWAEDYIQTGGTITSNGWITTYGGVTATANLFTYAGVHADDWIFTYGTCHSNGNMSTYGGLNASDYVITQGYVSAAGCVYASNVSCPSDERLKTNITILSNPLESVQQLRGVNYEWRRDEFPERKLAEGTQVGLIAQEVQQVVPQAVQEMPDGYLSVDYARLVPLLIEGMKEQQKRIEKLEATIKSMTP